MPRKNKNYSKRYGGNKAGISRQLMKIRKLAGQEGLTKMERFSGYAGVAGGIAQTVAQMAGLINSEQKFLDSAISAGISSTGSTANTTLTTMAEGDDIGQRNGRVVLSKSLQYKLSFNVNTTATGGTIIGYVFVLDKRSAIALSGTPWTDVFATADPQALIDKATDASRWVILKRGLIDLSAQNASKHVQGFINLKGIHQRFNGTAAANKESGQVYLFLIGNQIVNTPTITGNIRYSFYDN